MPSSSVILLGVKKCAFLLMPVSSSRKCARGKSFCDSPDADVILENFDALSDPIGDAIGRAPSQSRVENHDGEGKGGESEADETVQKRKVEAEQNRVYQVTDQIESGADDERPIETMSISVAPIQRTPRDNTTTKFRRVPPNDVREVLDHLYSGQPTELLQVNKVDGEDSGSVEEEVESLTNQILSRQHP
jgi:hypothetical protein